MTTTAGSLDPDRVPATLRVLRAVALASAPGAPAPRAGIDLAIVPDPDDLVTAAAAHRLTGPLLHLASHGLVELEERPLDRLGEAHLAALAGCLRIESRLWSILGWLEPHGITPLVLKGSAIAHLDESDPALRTFGDLDLLVHPDDLATVLGVLGERGAVRPFAERRAGYDRRFAKSVTVTFPDHVEIDVHRTICDGVHGLRVPIDRLHRRPDRYELGGRTVHAPDRTARVLHAAYHAVLGSTSPRLLNLRDLVGYLATAERDGTWEAIADEVARWRGTAVLAQAVRDARRHGAALPVWDAWLDRTPVPAEEVAIVEEQRRAGSSFGRSRLRAARELDRPRDRGAYLLAAVAPSPRHLRSRGRTRLDLFRSEATNSADELVLPDLPPRAPGHGDRILVLGRPDATAVDRPPRRRGAADGVGGRPTPPASASVHLLVRSGSAELRERLWREDRPATVVELPGGPGWRRRWRRLAVATDELRRFDPDRVVVERRSLPLLLPALAVGRSREVEVLGADRTPPGRRSATARAADALAGRVLRRHRLVDVGPGPDGPSSAGGTRH